jgi:hypothetical protein
MKDIPKLTHVEAGDGRLICVRPPAKITVHPGDKNNVHEQSFGCVDIEAFISTMM